MMALLVMMGSCNPEKLSVSDYLEWVNNPENGLKVSKELNDYKFELLYKPVEYIAINEQRKLDVDTISYYHRIEELKEMQYYTLKIETLTGLEMMKAGIGSEQEYSNRLQYFSDLAQYDITLVDGGDTLTCALFHFERNYGVAPYNNIVLGFFNNKKNNSKTLIFNERVLEVGRVKLKIKEKDINNIPEIILN